MTLLTPGQPLPAPAAAPGAAAAAPSPPGPPPAAPAGAGSTAAAALSDVTPLATAVVPHSLGEFVGQSESRQNSVIIGGLIALFVVVLSILGIVFDLKLLVVSPIAVGLSIAAVWLWLRKQRLERKAQALQAHKDAKRQAAPP